MRTLDLYRKTNGDWCCLEHDDVQLCNTSLTTYFGVPETTDNVVVNISPEPAEGFLRVERDDDINWLQVEGFEAVYVLRELYGWLPDECYVRVECSS